MSFLDIKDPAKRATLVKEYVTAMETVKQRNMVNREMKLATGDELQTPFRPMVNATNQAVEETMKGLAPMKKTLTDIDGALAAQRIDARPPPCKTADTTFGFYKKDGQLSMENKAVRLDIKRKILTVDDTVYELTSDLLELITNKHPRPDQYDNDKEVYRSLVAQTRVKSFPNRTDGARPHATWKWKYMLKKIVIPGERIAEEEGSEDTDGTYTASIGDIGESYDMLSSDILLSDILLSDILLSDILLSDISSPAHTRSYGKAKKTKDREPFYKGYGVVYLPGDISGLAKKLHLLATEFFAGNSTVRNELFHVLDALLRLKQLTRKEYADITARLAAS